MRFRINTVALIFVMSVVLLNAQEVERKSLVLPKSPVAAAYVLGRLSNKELSEAPRGEFVYVALLQRKGLDRKYRVEAIEGLARIRNTDPLTELLRGIAELDRKGEASEAVLQDLLPVLLQLKPKSLTEKRDQLEKLAEEAQLPLTRQMAYSALITREGAAERSWQSAKTNPAQLTDLLLAIPLVRDAKVRTTFYSRVEPLLHQADPAAVRRAAIIAISAIPNHDAETFLILAALVKSGVERDAAIASLQKIPRSAWPKEEAAPLIASLIAYLQNLPVEKRGETEAANAFQFATDLAAFLPTEQASAVGKTLRGLGVSVFVIRTIPEQMLYDKTLIVVTPGQPVSIVLINADAMPHNLVITSPGALEEIGMTAEKMSPEADAEGRFYVPASLNVLHATKMVAPGQQVKLSFTAPDKPGEYQYVCTFPGHWRRMAGTLAVVPDVEAYLASHAALAQPKITEWKIEDLVPHLAKLNSNRDLARGKEVFIKLACASCHQLGGEGVSFGPELTDVFARYQNNPAEVLRQILEPSLVVSNRYRGFDFELQNGDELSGMIIAEESEVLTVQSGPAASLTQRIEKADVKNRKPQKSSLMPMGLLNALSAEEILDLLAYIQARGEIPALAHHH